MTSREEFSFEGMLDEPFLLRISVSKGSQMQYAHDRGME